MLKEFIYWSFWDQFRYVAAHTVIYMLDLLAAFGPFTLFFFIFGLRQLIAENMWKASALVGLALLINWLFTGEMRWQFSVKYVGEVFFVIYPVASLGVTIVARRFSVRIQRLVILLYLVSSVGFQWAFMYQWAFMWLKYPSDYLPEFVHFGALSVDIMALIRSVWTTRVELLSNLILMSAVMALLMIWRRSGRDRLKA